MNPTKLTYGEVAGLYIALTPFMTDDEMLHVLEMIKDKGESKEASLWVLAQYKSYSKEWATIGEYLDNNPDAIDENGVMIEDYEWLPGCELKLPG